MIASVISAYYYLNIVRRMYFNEPGAAMHLKAGFVHRLAFAGAAAAMILAVAPIEPINGFGADAAADAAAQSLMNGPQIAAK